MDHSVNPSIHPSNQQQKISEIFLQSLEDFADSGNYDELTD